MTPTERPPQSHALIALAIIALLPARLLQKTGLLTPAVEDEEGGA